MPDIAHRFEEIRFLRVAATNGDYVAAGGHTYVRIGSVPHDQERFVVFRFRAGTGGQLPIGLVYSDLARRGRFGVS